MELLPTLAGSLHTSVNSSARSPLTPLSPKQLIHVADLLAKETEDFDFHLMQTVISSCNLTCNLDADALNAFHT